MELIVAPAIETISAPHVWWAVLGGFSPQLLQPPGRHGRTTAVALWHRTQDGSVHTSSTLSVVQPTGRPQKHYGASQDSGGKRQAVQNGLWWGNEPICTASTSEIWVSLNLCYIPSLDLGWLPAARHHYLGERRLRTAVGGQVKDCCHGTIICLPPPRRRTVCAAARPLGALVSPDWFR